MMKLKGLILAALVALPVATLAQPAPKDWEITLGGNGTATHDFRANGGQAGGAFGAGLSLGYYLNDNVEVAVRQSLGFATSGAFSGSTRAAFDYNFRMDKLVPFVGINGGFAYANRGGLDAFVFSPEAGIKYYLQSKAFLFGMAEYQIPTRGRDSFENGNFVFTLGLGINL